MTCVCRSVFELEGSAADRYAREHLERLDLDLVTWTVRYSCPDTGRRWVRDFPHGELQAGGPPRLRQLDQDGEPVDEPGRDPSRGPDIH